MKKWGEKWISVIIMPKFLKREERGERNDVIDGEREKEISTMILPKLED